MKEEFLFLGTGGSLGIPIVGCECAVCHSDHAYNKRLRTSGLLKIEGKQFLIDVGPDFRAQALKHKIFHLDGLLLTHTHYDHVAGLDELRTFYFMYKKPTPCLLSPDTLEELKIRYHYFLPPFPKDKAHKTNLKFHLLQKEHGDVHFEGVPFEYVTYLQAGMKVNGFKYKDFAYMTDIFEYTDEVIEKFKGTKTLVISALRWEKSKVHLSMEDALAVGEKIGAKKIYLTHITHDLEHETTQKKLPPDVHMGYDGLTIPI